MKNYMKSVLTNKTLPDQLMRGSGSCIDDIKANGADYQARVRMANAAPPLSEAYEGIYEPLPGL